MNVLNDKNHIKAEFMDEYKDSKRLKWRPRKLTREFLDALEEIVNDWINALIHTDEELLVLTNLKLKKEFRMSSTTFEDYKAMAWKYERWEWVEDKTIENNKEFIEFLIHFSCLIKQALVIQKWNLFKDLKNWKSWEWQREAWIIERKFSDWNLRNITENKNINDNNWKLEIKIIND